MLQDTLECIYILALWALVIVLVLLYAVLP